MLSSEFFPPGWSRERMLEHAKLQMRIEMRALTLMRVEDDREDAQEDDG
jgi:hypothetical protein